MTTRAEVNLGAILGNLEQIRAKVSPAQIMAVVKSNAYGHGLMEVASVLAERVDYLGVARLSEGLEIRKQLPGIPVLVFGGFFVDQIDDFITHDLDLTLYDRDRALALNERAAMHGRGARVHVKVDTGMSRVGIAWQQAQEFIEWLSGLSAINIVGVYTHLATADEPESAYAKLQLSRFNEVISALRATGMRLPIFHAANSGAILTLKDAGYDLVRPGIALYGYYPSPQTPGDLVLQPALTLKSRVLSLTAVSAGTDISYNRTYRTSRPTRIATVPVGYGDGYNRLLSNQASVLIGGQRCRVVGTVCMDLLMVDVGTDLEVAVGDEVVLLGRQAEAEINMQEICSHLKTIPYEVACWISARVERRFL